MFTGLVQAFGSVLSMNMLGERRYALKLTHPFSSVQTGESIAVDGVCLTVLPESNAEALVFDVSPETATLTTLSDLSSQDTVHLERALLASSRIGGHYLTGHVDTHLKLEEKTWHGDCLEMVFSGLKPETRAYVMPKGSIALAGVSLTINTVTASTFSVMLIPHTLAHTHLKSLEPGGAINVEFDHLSKMVAERIHLMGLANVR